MSVESILSGLKKVRRTGKGWLACCPVHDDREPSLSISQGADGTTLVHCHAGCSQEAVINELKAMGLWMLQNNEHLLAQQTGQKSNNRSTDNDNKKKCFAIWEQTLNANHEEAAPLRSYIKSRGLNTNSLPICIRFHPNLSYYENGTKIGSYPALVAKVSGKDGNGIGLQRIYLTRDGQKANVPEVKKAIGKLKGGAIRLDDPNDVLHLAEGIETALAVRQATGEPTWATVSATGLEKVELPSNVKTVHIWADLDRSETGEKSAQKLATRLYQDGITVFVHLPDSPIPDDHEII
ncbi:toprim domain-containing protein [Acidobacteria bacterium AH-259-G07]|nr:toprim domain-containing protein [Acidobacteria bacterium AH-259-G07]